MAEFPDGILIQRRIGRVRRKLLRVTILDVLFRVVGVCLLALAIGMLADWTWDLPLFARVLILILDLGLLSWIGYRKGILPINELPDDEEIALRVQRAWPEVGDRLISAVQFSRPGGVDAGASKELAGAVIVNAREAIDRHDLTQVVSTEGVARIGFGVIVFLLALLLGFRLSGAWGVDLLKRALLSDTPVPRNTQLELETPDRVLAIGESTVLKVKAAGRVPQEGILEIRDSRRLLSLTIKRDDDDCYIRPVENVQESFDWRIKAGDNQTPWARVQAIARPAAAAIKFTTYYPTYINKPPEEKTPGNLLIPAGGKLKVEITATQKLKSAELILVGLGVKVPMEGFTDRFWGEFDVPSGGLVGLTLGLVNDWGIESKEMTVYPVDILPDKAPLARIIRPNRRDITATAAAKVEIEFEAADDYGIEKILLWRKLDSQKDEQAKSTEMDLSNFHETQKLQVHRMYRMEVSAMKPLEGDVLEFWLEVVDGNVTTGPGKTPTDRCKVKIVSAAEKEAEVMSRLNEQLGAIDFVAEDQEKINNSLVRWIDEKK